MNANKTIEAAEENLKKFLRSGLRRLARTHTLDVEIASIIKLLNELEGLLLWLKAMTTKFHISVSIREVTNFDSALNSIITQCGLLSQHPASFDRAYLSDEFNKMEMSLHDQIEILQGKKPSPPPRSDVVGKLASTVLDLTKPNPGETSFWAAMRGVAHIGAERIHGVVNARKPDVPKPSAKEMVGSLYSRVETLMKVCKNRKIGTTLSHVKSRLDELRKESLIDYVDDIERKTLELHFCIIEVEDLKKELSKGMRVCSVDLSKAYNTNNMQDHLHKLDTALENQVLILKHKVVEHGLMAKILHGHHNH